MIWLEELGTCFMELPCLVKHPKGTVAQGSRNSGPCLRSEIQASPQNLPQDGLKRLNSKPICTYIYIMHAWGMNISLPLFLNYFDVKARPPWFIWPVKSWWMLGDRGIAHLQKNQPRVLINLPNKQLTNNNRCWKRTKLYPGQVGLPVYPGSRTDQDRI